MFCTYTSEGGLNLLGKEVAKERNGKSLNCGYLLVIVVYEGGVLRGTLVNVVLRF